MLFAWRQRQQQQPNNCGRRLLLLYQVIFGYYFGILMPILDFNKVTLVTHIGNFVPHLR
jgi:hypothetical protein